ncbi:MAG: GDP-mannose 4,6-dehydratase [Candidatus Portnoybacteria bacterium]|nr:GDP-mannose 4,6-dehydratase [Candidatus Portnoybacteria bacterium]
MNILVTGGAGFMGSHFIRYLLEHYHDINMLNYRLLLIKVLNLTRLVKLGTCSKK